MEIEKHRASQLFTFNNRIESNMPINNRIDR